MSKIFISGAGGFIGSHLVEECVRNDDQVTAFVHYNSSGSWGWLDGSPVTENIKVIAGDIRDYDSVFKAMQGCERVFHLAALIGIPYSYISPLAYVRTNIEGTYNILEAAKNHDIQSVIVTSTSETYGSAQYVPIDEKHPMVGQSPYSASKIGADQLAISYYRSFGIPVKIARPFNTYGPRQSARAIIPTIITQLLRGKSEIKLGNLDPTRDLNYVKDTVSGFLAIAGNDSLNGEVINIGSRTEISIGDLVSLICRIMGSEIRIIEEQVRIRPVGSEVERLMCDNTKIVSLTQWRPKYDLVTGLSETISWIEENLDSYKSEIYNV